MNLWLGPKKPPNNEKWRYIQTVDGAIEYLTQHFHNGKFVGVDIIKLPVYVSYVYEFCDKIKKFKLKTLPDVKFYSCYSHTPR